MERIRSIKGDIDKKLLGVCQCHEHLFIADGPSRTINKALYIDDYEKSYAEAMTFKKAGGNSFIDAQPYRCGRMSEKTLELCRETGLNAICCTGFHKIEFHESLEWLESIGEDELTQVFISEVRDGMTASNGEKTTAKAGLIKCALTREGIGFNKTYDKLFNAVRHAAAETLAPVYVHLDSGTDALKMIDFFTKNCIDANKLILCHLDRARYDFGYHCEVAQTGVFLEYDTIQRTKYHSDAEEIALILHMVEKGFVDKLLLGMDETNLRLKSYGAPFGMDYILTEFQYKLKDVGIGKDAFMQIMINNAADALAFAQ